MCKCRETSVCKVVYEYFLLHNFSATLNVDICLIKLLKPVIISPSKALPHFIVNIYCFNDKPAKCLFVRVCVHTIKYRFFYH